MLRNPQPLLKTSVGSWIRNDQIRICSCKFLLSNRCKCLEEALPGTWLLREGFGAKHISQGLRTSKKISWEQVTQEEFLGFQCSCILPIAGMYHILVYIWLMCLIDVSSDMSTKHGLFTIVRGMKVISDEYWNPNLQRTVKN